MIQECGNPIVEDDFHGFSHRNCEGTEQLRRKVKGGQNHAYINKGTECDQADAGRLWTKLDDAISEVLDSITLADMLDWQNELMGDQYVI